MSSTTGLTQWQWGSDAELCLAGTADLRLDASICSRAIAATADPALTATLLAARARALYYIGETDSARQDAELAVERQPLSALTHAIRGLVRHGDGDYRNALADFDQALALNPFYADAYRHRATTYFFLGRLETAAEDFAAALRLNPLDREALALRGMNHYRAKRFAAAAADFERLDTLSYAYDYLPLWRYLARQRAAPKRSAQRQLSEEAEQLGSHWPAPLLAVYLDTAALSQGLAALEHVSPRQRSEGLFYLAQWLLLNPRRASDTAAEALLRAVVAAGFDRSIEFVIARAALERRSSQAP